MHDILRKKIVVGGRKKEGWVREELTFP